VINSCGNLNETPNEYLKCILVVKRNEIYDYEVIGEMVNIINLHRDFVVKWKDYSGS
jgi:hypothetical protein